VWRAWAEVKMSIAVAMAPPCSVLCAFVIESVTGSETMSICATGVCRRVESSAAEVRVMDRSLSVWRACAPLGRKRAPSRA